MRPPAIAPEPRARNPGLIIRGEGATHRASDLTDTNMSTTTSEPLDLILGRRSIRVYSPGEVSEAAVTKLLEAAMAAPSAMTKDPWRFVVVRDRPTLAQSWRPSTRARRCSRPPRWRSWSAATWTSPSTADQLPAAGLLGGHREPVAGGACAGPGRLLGGRPPRRTLNQTGERVVVPPRGSSSRGGDLARATRRAATRTDPLQRGLCPPREVVRAACA